MRKYGLIGYPLGHSWSKKYFTEKFLKERINDCQYELFPLEHLEELPSLLENEKELLGINVTIPYKSDIIRYLDELSPEANEIGAVNVIRISRENGRIRLNGYNSDATGFFLSLKPFLTNQRTAIVLGTGGSSKAVVYALKKAGINVIIVSRSPSPQTITYRDLNESFFNEAGLIINTTPLGMFPNMDEKPPVPYEFLKSNHILYDLVYNPEMTSFMKMGKEVGCTVISGLEMLKLQAEKAWEIWNDLTAQ
ncbi:MAG TPA: shikimate dehydrogenase [Bacteroidales bacterium]|nr:shikimate dehydrogenase [Bacteroidales bacterium]